MNIHEIACELQELMVQGKANPDIVARIDFERFIHDHLESIRHEINVRNKKRKSFGRFEHNIVVIVLMPLPTMGSETLRRFNQIMTKMGYNNKPIRARQHVEALRKKEFDYKVVLKRYLVPSNSVFNVTNSYQAESSSQHVESTASDDMYSVPPVPFPIESNHLTSVNQTDSSRTLDPNDMNSNSPSPIAIESKRLRFFNQEDSSYTVNPSDIYSVPYTPFVVESNHPASVNQTDSSRTLDTIDDYMYSVPPVPFPIESSHLTSVNQADSSRTLDPTDDDMYSVPPMPFPVESNHPASVNQTESPPIPYPDDYELDSFGSYQ